jgi:CheY-like chemotaxis protein
MQEETDPKRSEIVVPSGEFASSQSHVSNMSLFTPVKASVEPALLYTREKILQSAGYEVLSAADGKKALEIFANDSAAIEVGLEQSAIAS